MSLKELQEALDNRPRMEKRIPTLTDFIKYDEKLDEWFEDFTRKFALWRFTEQVRKRTSERELELLSRQTK